MSSRIALLPGDGVGPEVVAAAFVVLQRGRAPFRRQIRDVALADWRRGAARAGLPALPPSTLQGCQESDAVLLGAVGDPRFDHLPRAERLETGLLALRQALGVYANLRPAQVWPSLEGGDAVQAGARRRRRTSSSCAS